MLVPQAWGEIVKSPIFSDQARLDIPCVEHAMSDIRFNYLEILTVTWDSWFSEAIKSILKSQCKYPLYLAKYSNGNIQFYLNTNMIPITGLYNPSITTLGILYHWGGTCGLKLAQAHCCLWNFFVSCSVFILCIGLSHLFTWFMLVWRSQWGSHTVMN